MTRLTAKTLAEWRATTLAAQQGKCALCRTPITDTAVADHNHTTGQLRGVLHRSCNSLLGKVENNYKRYGVKAPTQLAAMLSNTATYLFQRLPEDAPLYPTYRTNDEKRVQRNLKARRARAASKGT